MMDYYEVWEDPKLTRRWHLYDVVRDGKDVAGLDEGKRVAADPVEIELQIPGPAPDYVINYLGVAVVSHALGAAIEELAGDQVQRIPAKVGKATTHEVLNVTRAIHCLDHARSEYEPREGTPQDACEPEYSWVSTTRIDPSRVPEGTHIFRLGGATLHLLISYELKRRLEERGFTGMSFRPAFDTPETKSKGRPGPAGPVVPSTLQRALRDVAGTFEDELRMALIGFEAGGPVSMVAAPGEPPWASYLTTELASSDLVLRGRGGAYELLVTGDDEDLAQEFLTGVARVGAGNVLADGGLVGLAAGDGLGPLPGAVLEEVARAKVEGRTVRVLRCHGLLASELRWAGEHGGPAILKRLRKAKVVGISARRRPAVVP